MTDFNRKSGTTIEITTTVTNPATGLAIDLTGLLGAYFTAKASPLDPDDVALFTGSLIDGRVVVTDAANGQIRTRIPPSETSGYTRSKRVHWSLKIKESDSDVWSPDSGILMIELDIRRAVP